MESDEPRRDSGLKQNREVGLMVTPWLGRPMARQVPLPFETRLYCEALSVGVVWV